MTTLTDLRNGWDQAARENATFNILTDHNYRSGGWPEAEFFDHGTREIRAVLDRLDTLELLPGAHHRALDFGCGVGRLTQALGEYYRQVLGVDSSPEMIRLAEMYKDRREASRCSFRVTGKRLQNNVSGEFNLIYSCLVLQHMPQNMQRSYIREFLDLLAYAGIAVFQLPQGPDFQHENPWLSMHGTEHSTVERWVKAAGGRVLDMELLPDDTQWDSFRYTVTAS